MAGSGYLSKSDWIAAGLAFGIALLLYLATLAPTVTLEASGQLVVAADHLGVARPPGYPVWTLLAKGFIGLFPFARYHGHPNPAWAVHLLSAVCGALACGLLALLTARTARDLAPSRAIAALSGVAAGLLFAASRSSGRNPSSPKPTRSPPSTSSSSSPSPCAGSPHPMRAPPSSSPSSPAWASPSPTC
jgi:hypothetical protein